ncbi:MAG: DUF2332 domain-containing protein [Acidimicrobiia bacterium]|nr:DUF2332 domain-containing protein [Acidimicrobiia bacterium]MBT8217729.1 DUF2332 domain-containing protein [Acidimicrobiia bacterium]NNF09550.1 DUF2332 domain-containing protein [Acidimicrobiia bacterium]NNL71488.1 DUF2332 domain-containing protein [Acidimicrobiia bacterium]
MSDRHIYDRSNAEQFAAFADAVGDETPLYTRLGRAVVDDPGLLDLTSGTLPGQPAPNVLFAAVQYLLLGGAPHELAAWYPGLSGTTPPSGDPVPAFADFCRSYEAELRRLISTRRTQTNEVGRCLALLPALAAVERRLAAPVRLIEIGASAGLLLLLDRYHYTYGARTWGPTESPVRLTTELRAGPPPLPAHLDIQDRVGIDLNPIDVTNPDDARWLEALVWPGHETRQKQLRSALGVAVSDPPDLVAGDALDVLPRILSDAPPGAVPVVYHSFALIQWSDDQRARLDRLLSTAGRRVVRIWLEWFGYQRNRPLIRLFDYPDGPADGERLGRFHHHGRWLEWGATGS